VSANLAAYLAADCSAVRSILSTMSQILIHDGLGQGGSQRDFLTLSSLMEQIQTSRAAMMTLRTVRCLEHVRRIQSLCWEE
jgi:hypothetical protein